MSEQYLWDRSGERDPEIARLETLLAGYRERRRRFPWKAALAAACVALIAIAWSVRPRQLTEWAVNGKRLAVGEAVPVADGRNTRLEASSLGQIDVTPDSRVRVRTNQRLDLERGTLHAFIWAPPATFLVDTPSARTIDLGCSYTLTVNPNGLGLLRVAMGWVAFEAGGRESFIPAGAACGTRPKLGPGLPYFENAPEALREAVSRFDATQGREGLPQLLASARPQDALTLWHVLVRTSGADRDRAVERFATLVPEADVPGLKAGDAKAIDAAWNLLGLGETAWWRRWRREWAR